MSARVAVHALAEERGTPLPPLVVAAAGGRRRLPALVYLAELRIRTGAPDLAARLLAEVAEVELSAADRERLADELSTAADLSATLETPAISGTSATPEAPTG
ncbi:hypothetical protein [Nonomuraea jiangxiensis]|uniref:Uncharacterized protein n=1 Tax=Nonomuraea jiangxiensis TaxID=633440 RepID=A0A1G9AZN0_9ACTN|nr:hypothetical protein [Nonomuraea jiangxiensis]SDK32160.1 hypothetical protein SAMN05421869_11585 [Nonomuraea jiangxiensis]